MGNSTERNIIELFRRVSEIEREIKQNEKKKDRIIDRLEKRVRELEQEIERLKKR